MRYDHLGIGNSSQNSLRNEIHKDWIKTPSVIQQHLKNQYSIRKVIFVGVRSGALVLSEAQRTTSIEHLVYWYPHTLGKIWLKDLTTLDEANGVVNDDSWIEAGGYPLLTKSYRVFENINLAKTKLTDINSCLIIESKACVSNKNLIKCLNTANYFKFLKLEGMSQMIKPDNDLVPTGLFKPFLNWGTIIEGKKFNSLAIDESTSYTESGTLDSFAYEERILNINLKKPIFGIFNNPKDGMSDILILANFDREHHIGDKRLNVELARHAAYKGLASFRFDFSHLGESDQNLNLTAQQSNQQMIVELAHIIKILKNKFKKPIILVGCSNNAIHFLKTALLLESNTIKHLVLVNPLELLDDSEKKEKQIELVEGVTSNVKQQISTLNKLVSKKINHHNILRKAAMHLAKKPKLPLDNKFFQLKKKQIQFSILQQADSYCAMMLETQAPYFVTHAKEQVFFNLESFTKQPAHFTRQEDRKILVERIVQKLI